MNIGVIFYLLLLSKIVCVILQDSSLTINHEGEKLDRLTELKKKFNPRRHYEDGDTTIDVDGVFIRIDEDLVNQRGNEILEFPIEDLLQDSSIIRSARVSTGRDTKDVNEKAQGLIAALYKGVHETPFEGGVMFRLRVRIPICRAQPFFQLPYAHNEFSGRYSIIDGDFYIPSYAQKDQDVLDIFNEAEKDSRKIYKSFLESGMALEQARFALLFRFFTEFYWTVSLRHLLELLALEPNNLTSQEFWRIRDTLIVQIIKDWAPWTDEILKEHQRVISTRWHERPGEPAPLRHFTKERAKQLQDSSKVGCNIANIGQMHLIDYSGREEVLELAVQTGPNPRRGFGHASMTFLLEVPIFVHRQWVRHRYGSWSELPVDFDDIVRNKDFYIPLQFRKKIGKTMSYIYEDMNERENNLARKELKALIKRSCKRFWELRRLGLSPEQASHNLPYVFRIPTLWTANLESLMNFFSLRCDDHAQWEIRQFANMAYSWFADLFPWADNIFLNNLNFGKSDLFKK